MRAYAVVPPILLEERKRRYRYNNQNGKIDDPLSEYKENKNINIWTPAEKDAFREKFLQHPKNFVAIASYLERKSVSDCVQYYYSSKKKENYKLLVKRRIKRPRKGNQQPTGMVEVIGGLDHQGVTTRGSHAALQREQAQRTIPPGSAANSISHSEYNDINNIGYSISNTPCTTTTTSTTEESNMNANTSNSNNKTICSGATDIICNSISSGSLASTNATNSNSVTIINVTPSQSIVNSTTTTTDATISSMASVNPSNQEVREKDKENLTVIR